MILVKEQRDHIPYDPSPLQPITRATEKGFQVVDVPPAVYSILTEFYDRSKFIEENYAGKEHYSKQISYLQDINQYPDKVKFIKETLLDMHQEWCGRTIKPAVVYGIRSYSANSIFKAHFDRQDTHHVASSITMGKDAPWNLNIQDHDGQWWGVDVEPGQMIMFESGCCMHGRLDEYQGTYFDNIYAHYTYNEPFAEYKG